MSGWMDGVPVKISEKYKPPSTTYRVSQEAEKHLGLADKYYSDAQQYSYDFQLERKVLTKITEWRHMRQLRKEARDQRKEERDHQRLRDIELQQKKLLCAVSYPSTEDLSSSSESEVEEDTKPNTQQDNGVCADQMGVSARNVLTTPQNTSFHNILQPIILSPQSAGKLCETNANTNDAKTTETTKKILSNFEDFEVITSTPFDQFELKTIDDLDVLAQVLKSAKELNSTSTSSEQRDTKETEENSNEEVVHAVANLSLIESTKSALEKVNFNDLHDQYHQQQHPNENIPQTLTSDSRTAFNGIMPSVITSTSPLHVIAPLDNQYDAHYNHQPHQLMATYMPYSSQLHKNSMEKRQQHLEQSQHQQQFINYNVSQLAAYNNQNYIYNANNTNGVTNMVGPQYYDFVGSNANNYGNPNAMVGLHSTTTNFNNGDQYEHQHTSQYTASTTVPSENSVAQSQSEAESMQLKSKSVPDILKELSDEIHNSKMRRTRKYSHNCDEDTDKVCERTAMNEYDVDVGVTQKVIPSNNSVTVSATKCYAKLEESVQKLAKNISSMGFPLERVAKIAQMFGTDDKKIIEHLIPLSELMDLGFDETKISEALLKFSNNKDKALEYLIS